MVYIRDCQSSAVIIPASPAILLNRHQSCTGLGCQQSSAILYQPQSPTCFFTPLPEPHRAALAHSFPISPSSLLSSLHAALVIAAVAPAHPVAVPRADTTPSYTHLDG